MSDAGELQPMTKMRRRRLALDGDYVPCRAFSLLDLAWPTRLRLESVPARSGGDWPPSAISIASMGTKRPLVTSAPRKAADAAKIGSKIAPCPQPSQTMSGQLYVVAPVLGALLAVPLCIGVREGGCCPPRPVGSTTNPIP